MKEYVICYAHRLPLYQMQEIALIERKKDDWQIGKLNLPGGSIEPGEAPEVAAHRELKEETGIDSSLLDIKVIGLISGPGWKVHVCYCPYQPWKNGAAQEPQSLCGVEGKIVTMRVSELINDPRLIPNLKLIIPFCLAKVTGWEIREDGTPTLSVSL